MNTATRRLVDVLRPAHVEPAVVAGLRAALSLSVPFAVGVIFDDVERWSLVANGAFLVALCNVGGAYAIRAWVTLIAVVAIPLTAAVATFAADDVWLAAPLGFVFVAMWSFTPVLGTRFAFLGLTIAVTYIVYLHSPAAWDWAEVDEVLWLSALGALWGAVLSLAGWRLLRERPGRLAVARAFRDVGHLAASLQAGDGRWRERSAEARVRSIDAIPEVLGDIVASPADVRDPLLALFDRAYAIGQQAVLAADEGDQGLPGVAVSQIATSCEAMAVGLAGDERWWRWRGTRPGRATLAESLRAADELLAALGGHPPPDLERLHRFRSQRRVRAAGRRLRSNLTMGSLLYRHAIRVAVTVAVAIVVFEVADIPSGYWIPMTVILVLKPDIGATLDRAVQRSLGTIVGAVIGAVIVAVVTSDAVLAAVLFPLAWFMVALVPLNYAYWAIAITPLVIVIRDTGDIGDWGLAAIRTLNTFVGVALALVAGFVLWPSWTRLRLPVAVQRLMAAFERWTMAVVRSLGSGRSDPEQLAMEPGSLHMDVLQARTNVAIAVEQLGRELPRHPVYLGAASAFELAAVAYTDAVADLAEFVDRDDRDGRGDAGGTRGAEPERRLEGEVADAFAGRPPEIDAEATGADAEIDRLRVQLGELVAAEAALRSTPATG